MSYLAIQILGPLRLWDVDDDGVWHPLQISTGGGTAGLLGVFIFRSKEVTTWTNVAEYMWGPSVLLSEEKQCDANFRKHMQRLRKQLKPHGDVLSKGRVVPGLTGPASSSLRVDWHDFQDYQLAKEDEKALSLFRGLPLLDVKTDGTINLDDLRTKIKMDVEERVRLSLVRTKTPVPESLDTVGPLLKQFAAYTPADWSGFTPETPEAPATGQETQTSRRRPPKLLGNYCAADLFELCPDGEERLSHELEEAGEDQAHTWWSKGQWLGKFFAFWLKLNTRRCEEVALTLIDDVYDAARFDVPEADEPKDKATILEAPAFYGDNPKKEILCGRTNWGLAYEWAKSHGDEILAHPSRPSAFGVVGRPAYPGIAGVHTLVQTSDGYLLFGLRAPDIAFHERTWSATFEEQVAVGARDFTGPLAGDQTLLNVIVGGLYEEWGIDEDAVEISSCLAIGREWGRDRFREELMFNLSATIVTACRLNIALADVWANLDEAAGIEDIDEHRAWAGIRFVSRADVLRFVASAKGRWDNKNLLEELCAKDDVDAELALYPHKTATGLGDRGLMPTSAARLVLASGWFETLKDI